MRVPEKSFVVVSVLIHSTIKILRLLSRVSFVTYTQFIHVCLSLSIVLHIRLVDSTIFYDKSRFLLVPTVRVTK